MDGAGEKAFCAGADVNDFSEAGGGETSSRSVGRFIRDFPAPVIAKIQGFCLGGGLETALACDFRYASEDSTLGLPEADLGITPGAGGIQYIAREASPDVAKEFAMTGERISAARAADEGIIHDVYETDALDEEVDAFAKEIASKAPLAIQGIKESANMATQTGLQEGIRFDSKLADTLLETEDAKEGAAAFAEDREPEFEGK